MMIFAYRLLHYDVHIIVDNIIINYMRLLLDYSWLHGSLSVDL